MSSAGNVLIPSLCYSHALAAIAWLEQAFGFTPHLVVPGEEIEVLHAQLKSPDGTAMIMLYSMRPNDPQHNNKPPTVLGGCNQSLYMVVADVEEHHARAVAAGATITMPPTRQEYGGSCYSCSDLEGHLWTFGSHNPWSESPQV